MKVTAIIERGQDGRYSVYIEQKKYPYGIIGTGASVKEAKEDFEVGYKEMKQYVESLGDRFEEAELSFKYDIPSFLQDFAFAFTAPSRNAYPATQPGVHVALSLYESEEAFKSGKNPTVRFDNDGLLENKKLLLKE